MQGSIPYSRDPCVRREKGLGMGQLNALMGLLGHTVVFGAVFLSLFLALQATDAAAGRRGAALASSPEGKMKGVLLGYSGGRWGSCPTLPHGELRL